MCGIVGCFGFGETRPDPALWTRLAGCVSHRGPDADGFWSDGRYAFGHRRLAIIDLSERGRQPMATADGRFVVTFNGEIYNYLELRGELAAAGCRFTTNSDTEVLLHGYRAWGTGLPARLIGQFAFALADRERQELFIARDRFGEKPLLLRETGTDVAFASEMRALVSIPGATRALDPVALGRYLCLNYVPGDRTMMQGVRRLPPGTWRLYTPAGKAREGRFWSPPSLDAEPSATTDSEAFETLERLLRQAVRFTLRSDVPVGIFLSGGIDSSLIASFAAEEGSLSRGYCLTFDETSYSEWGRAQRTAARISMPLTEVRLEPSALGNFLDLVKHADDPLADSSGLAVWTIARTAAQREKVVLSGDGGDELFAGYLTYRATLMHNRIQRFVPAGLRRLVASAGARIPTSERKVSRSYKAMRYLRAFALAPNVAHFTWNGVWLPDDAARLVRDREAAAGAQGALEELARDHGVPRVPTLRHLQHADVSEYLPNDILAKADRMSMAHGLEVRAPFLEPALADFALRLPDRLKISRGGELKYLLRELARRRLGPEIADAPKQGFSIPVHGWLRGPGRELIEDLLSTESLAQVTELDPVQVRRAVDDHLAARQSLGWEIWGLAVLVAWHRQYIQRAPALPSLATHATRPEPAALAPESGGAR